jgi:transcriptional regulator with PAS, ATPase and Fis domain
MIVGQSPQIRKALHWADRFARTSLPVLLVGATGTGKDLFARHLHALSARRGEFVDVNCGALPRELVESLLFGHRRGAFTGAVADMTGLVSRASAGTLFLDELCSLGTEAQVKLLRVLETGQVRALGDTRNVAVEFRLVAAVQEDLGYRLESGAFREDLYHRIAGVVVHLPRLCERAGDIPLLAAHFAAQHGRSLGAGAAGLLEQYSWPGNVRELRTVIGRAAYLTEEKALGTGSLAEALSQGTFGSLSHGSAFPSAAQRRLTLLAACSAHGWDALRISAALGVSRATLYRRLKDVGISLRTSGCHHSPRRTA